MASFNKFNTLVEALAEKKHNLQDDTLKVMLSNSAPSVTNAFKSDITEISAGSGYTAGGSIASQASSEHTSGTYKLVLNDVVFTASGGTIGPFRYVVLYNDTATNDELIGWYDYGSSISLQNGETLTVDFNASTGILTIV